MYSHEALQRINYDSSLFIRTRDRHNTGEKRIYNRGDDFTGYITSVLLQEHR